jgi:aminodeoxyfutalosine deaminase
VTISSDDPPMFDTTLTDEYRRLSENVGFDVTQIKQFVMNGIQAGLLPSDRKDTLENEIAS